MDGLIENLAYDLGLVIAGSLVIWSVLFERFGLPDADRPWWMRAYRRGHEAALALDRMLHKPGMPPIGLGSLWFMLAFVNAAPLIAVIAYPLRGLSTTHPWAIGGFAFWALQIATLLAEAALVAPVWLRLRRQRRRDSQRAATSDPS